MSSQLPPANQSEPKEGHKHPRRRALQSGFSLLARAEPQIWFTGGMLAVCLAMVVCLMGLILASGLPTFWPQPIDWLALRDGSMDAGEAKATAVVAASEGTDKNATGTSVYYRTENFDLTSTHYRWFQPKDLSPTGIVRIPSLALIERFEWGHLYGIPLRLQVPLVANDADRATIESIELHETALKTLAQLPSFTTGATETDVAGLNQAIAAATELLEKTKSNALRKSIESHQDHPVQYRPVGEPGWRLKSELAANDKVEAARTIIDDPKTFEDRMLEVIPQVSAQRKRLERLKHELSRLDVRISRLRIAVRQAELDSDSILPIQLDAAHYDLSRKERCNSL